VTSNDFADIYDLLDDPNPKRARLKAAQWERRFQQSPQYQQYVADRQSTLPQAKHEACRAGGTWYYRVRASNAGSDSPWSNIESVTVTDLGTCWVHLPLVMRNLVIDPYEPNDTFEQAWGPLTSGQAYVAYIPQGDPDDFYYVNFTVLYPIHIQLVVPSALDLDLYIYDANRNLVAWSNVSGYGVDEAVNFTPATTGKYYIRIYPYAGWNQADPYMLTVEPVLKWTTPHRGCIVRDSLALILAHCSSEHDLYPGYPLTPMERSKVVLLAQWPWSKEIKVDKSITEPR